MNAILEKTRTYEITVNPVPSRTSGANRRPDWTELHRLRRELDELLMELRLEVIRLRSRP